MLLEPLRQPPWEADEKSKLLQVHTASRPRSRRRFLLCVATTLALCACGAALLSVKRNERIVTPTAQTIREYTPHWSARGAVAPIGWNRVERSDPQHRIRIIVGVKQTNLDKLEESLLSVSDPDNQKYGQHLSLQQTNNLIAPTEASINAVNLWMQDAGITQESIEHTGNSDFISATISAHQAEALLSAEFYVYEKQQHATHTHKNGSHATAPIRVLRTGPTGYKVPAHIAVHIDALGPTYQFPSRNLARTRTFPSRRLYKSSSWSGDDDPVWDGAIAANGIVPGVLEGLYSIVPDSGPSVDPSEYKFSNKQAVFDLATDIRFNNYTLQYYFDKFQPRAAGDAPSIVGTNGPRGCEDEERCGSELENSLDLDMIMGVGVGVPTEIWQPPFGPLDNTGTTTSMVDEDATLSWLYAVSSTPDASVPKVFSSSYGDEYAASEFELAVTMGAANMAPFLRRIDVEFQKAGVRGITIVVATGDNGVCGDAAGPEPPFGNNFCESWNWPQRFSAPFPASSAYVTAIGGTTLAGIAKNYHSTAEDLPSGLPSATEVAARLSTGGFSELFHMPDYQKAAVGAYLAKGSSGQIPNFPADSHFNPSGRATPDLSAQSFMVDAAVSAGGDRHTFTTALAGTSCSAPIVAGVVSLLNGVRMRLGKTPLGFLNPLLYSRLMPALNDVIYGANPGMDTNQAVFFRRLVQSQTEEDGEMGW